MPRQQSLVSLQSGLLQALSRLSPRLMKQLAASSRLGVNVQILGGCVVSLSLAFWAKSFARFCQSLNILACVAHSFDLFLGCCWAHWLNVLQA